MRQKDSIDSSPRRFAENQPQRGDLVALCAHARLPGAHHWLKTEGEAFLSTEHGHLGDFDWILCCDACFATFELTSNIHLAEFIPWDDFDDPDAPIITLPEGS